MSNTQNIELFTTIDDSQASTINGGSVSLLVGNAKVDIQEPSINDLLAQLTPQQLRDLILREI